MTPPQTARVPYEEPDDPAVMTRDAVFVKSESHQVRAMSRLAAARSVVEAAPSALLQKAPAPVKKTALTVSDAAAKFAAKLFD